MSRTKLSRGIGKAREDHTTCDPVPVAKRTVRSTEEPASRMPSIDFTKNTWSVRMAAAWAGVPVRTLYRMLRAGMMPCVAMGESQTQKLSRAKLGKRERRCYRFIIPRAAFVKAWENLGSVKETQGIRRLNAREERRAVEELPDAHIEQLMNWRKRKADLIAEMKEAERVGDLNLAMQIAKTLCDIDDQLTPKCRALNP
jgi:hypothetical protein